MTSKSILLDEGLISFGSAIDARNLNLAVNILEQNHNKSNTLTMWSV